MEAARAKSQSQLAARAVAVAGEALRIERTLANEGRGEPDAVDRAEISAAKAEDDQSQASQGLVAARARLLELRGELPAALTGAKPGNSRGEAGEAGKAE
jgi:outer membrane protein TolC